MPVMQSPPGAETTIDGRRYLYFAGTGYLGLQGHPEVIRAACQAAQQYGIGSATTRAWFGNTPPTLEVERLAAEFFAAEEAFYYVSGYVGNQVLTAVLAEQFDALLVDELSHYSVWEAARSSGRPVVGFHHRDPADLAAKLTAHLKRHQRPLVFSDGVFPVLGSIAPVTEYRQVLGDYLGSALAIDDAHAVAVLGGHGRGTFEHAGLLESGGNRDPGVAAESPGGPALWMSGTLSKAVGGFGGIIPGTRQFIERLKSRSHYFEAASPPPVPAAAATARALELIMADPGMRTRLWENVHTLKSGLRRLGLPTDDTPVPIVCLVLGSAANMQRIQRELMQRGTVIAYAAGYCGLGPEGALRLAIFCTHTEAMIEQLLDGLRQLL
jgi:7-keto-8-aminopelargonate synthetase-like enzyme